jgi:hypothetical protein
MALFGALFLLSACAKSSSDTTSTSVDASTSGTVASRVGGALSGSSSGTLAFAPLKSNLSSKFCLAMDMFLPMHFASAATSCPTIAAGGVGCSVTGSTATLTYAGCSFGASASTWTGSQIVALTGATPTCGSAFPTSMTSVTRTFYANTYRTTASGNAVIIDSSGAYTAVDGNACCTPTCGTITTAFSAVSGVTPTTLDGKLVGTGETLTLNSCSSASHAKTRREVPWRALI